MAVPVRRAAATLHCQPAAEGSANAEPVSGAASAISELLLTLRPPRVLQHPLQRHPGSLIRLRIELRLTDR